MGGQPEKLAGFEGLEIREGDGAYRSIDETAYTVEEGSTKITLLTEYLESLAAGDYTIRLMYTEGRTIDTNLQIVADGSDSSDSSDSSDASYSSDASDSSDAGDSTDGSNSEGGQENTESVESSADNVENRGAATSNPSTGDTSNRLSWIILAIGAGLALAGIKVYSRKRVK